MKKISIFLSLLIIAGCAVQEKNETYKPISIQKFLESPLGFNESIASFQASKNPKFKLQKLLRKNQHYPEKTDTIYHFTFKKSEIFFYKTYTGREFLLGGKILNSKIPLKNGIHVGITQNEFSSRFTNELTFKSDSIEMSGDGTKYTFLFKNKKLTRINIDNYFD